MIKARLLDGAASQDSRFRSGRAKVPHWASAIAILFGVTALVTALFLAAFGLFAALWVAHGPGNSAARPQAAQAVPQDPWPAHPGESAERIVPAPIAPPVMAKSEASETAAADPASTPTASVNPREEAAPEAPPASPPTVAPASPVPPEAVAPAAPAPPHAPASASRDSETTGSIDTTAPAEAAAPPRPAPKPAHARRHHAAKHQVSHKHARRIVRRPMQPAVASPFQPMFSSQ